jgi:hypothetical protein
MSNTPPPPGQWWDTMRRQYVSPADMRVSDAERHAMSEVLSRHYAEGRLDDAEFQERLARAMSAKTRADFSGLTYDLPRFDGQPIAALPRRRRRWLSTVILWAVVWVAIASAFGTWKWFFMPHLTLLFVAAAAVVILVRRGHPHHRHLDGHHHGGHLSGPPAGWNDGQSYIA